MSGQQIGTAVGFVAGFFLPGGPQVWAAVGGFIGGVVDPTEIEGPRIGDGPQQSANEGQPISWILGTAGWVQGNIVQISTRREVRKEDDGKGGPTTVTYEAHQDYCIMAAESSETRDSTIIGVLMVRLNGNIVYDMRPDSGMAAENAKFLQNHTFYYGAEDQLPDPTMEAITGVGNTPAYRGVFTMVARDVNLSQYGDAIPTYEFVLVSEGEVVTTTTDTLVHGSRGQFTNSTFPLVDPESYYEFTGLVSGPTGGGLTYSANTIQEIIDHFDGLYPGWGEKPDNYVGYSWMSVPDNTIGISSAFEQPDVTNRTQLCLVYQFRDSDYITSLYNADLFAAMTPDDGDFYLDVAGKLVTKTSDSSPPSGLRAYWDELGPYGSWYIYPLYITVTRKRTPPTETTDPDWIPLPDAPGYYIDPNTDQIVTEYTFAPVTGTFKTLAIAYSAGATPEFEYYEQGPILPLGHPDYNNETFWTDAYNAAVDDSILPSGWGYSASGSHSGTPSSAAFPILINTAFLSQQETESLVSNALSVATAIERICKRGGLLPSDIDTSDITATLLGYPIQADYNSSDCIKPLLAFCSSFASEYDAQLHFHPYGEAIEIIIDPQDFIEGSEDTDTGSREQAKEFPRKVSVNYIDIDQNYTVRPQSAWRTTPDVRAIGEETIQVPVCDFGDHAAKLAEIAIKVSYARLQGTRKFSLPYVAADTYLQLVSGMPFALDGKRWVANRVIIEDGQIAIDAAYDRQSAYTSIATGVPAPDPTPPVSTIGGVTLFVVMNLPALRDQDDRLVLYFAVAGLLTSWPGCLLQWSVDDGVSWQTAIASMTEQSVMGFLTSPLADAAAEGDDTTNTLSVSVNGGELNSITYTQYLNEQNPCAIVYADGTAEVMQFQTATEITEGNYDLTMLGRGRLVSVTGEHSSGARFTMLDSVYSMEIPSALIGREILFRPVTFNTAPENNATYSITFDPAVSQTELAPEFLTASIASDTLSLSVVPRHRFGTDITPIASVNFTGFRWSITDGSNTATLDTDAMTPSTTFDVTGWASPIDVSVSQLNRITGAGPALEESI